MLGIGSSSLLATSAAPTLAEFSSRTAALERHYGLRIGLCARAARDGRRLLAHREDEPFPLASTQKLPLVMAVLRSIDTGRLKLEQEIHFTRGDLIIAFSTIAASHPHGGKLSLEAICALTISDSDNTGAGILAALVGGPSAVTQYIHSLGVRNMRIDRTERDLPTVAAWNEVRDTTTPADMAQLLHLLVTKSVLSDRSTSMLLRWMAATITGDRRLRAGVPTTWRVADKTGSYENVANDVGVLYPPSENPIVVACYTFDNSNGNQGDAAIADVARTIAHLDHASKR
jgi:beta-lactamase class A